MHESSTRLVKLIARASEYSNVLRGFRGRPEGKGGISSVRHFLNIDSLANRVGNRTMPIPLTWTFDVP